MAEVAGLLIGSIALASLYSTCKDVFEFFALSESHSQDYDIAATKILLLKIRLLKWGEDARVEDPGREAAVLRENWDNCGEPVLRSLSGINAIFAGAEALSDKYGLEPRKKALGHYLYSRSSRGLREIRSRICAEQPKQHKCVAARRRAVWVIHDRRRFDRLIADLDFLITNLEHISHRICVHRSVSNVFLVQQSLEAETLPTFTMDNVRTLDGLKTREEVQKREELKRREEVEVAKGKLKRRTNYVSEGSQTNAATIQMTLHNQSNNQAAQCSINFNVTTSPREGDNETCSVGNEAKDGSTNFNGGITPANFDNVLQFLRDSQSTFLSVA